MSRQVVKVCRECGEEQPHSIRKSGASATWCIECQRKYSREHYRQNKVASNQRRYENLRVRRDQQRVLVAAMKSAPCMDCGIEYGPHVMQFDHRDGEGKLFGVAEGISMGVSMERIEAEAAKCDLVCANCHAERTYARRHGLGINSEINGYTE